MVLPRGAAGRFARHPPSHRKGMAPIVAALRRPGRPSGSARRRRPRPRRERSLPAGRIRSAAVRPIADGRIREPWHAGPAFACRAPARRHRGDRRPAAGLAPKGGRGSDACGRCAACSARRRSRRARRRSSTSVRAGFPDATIAIRVRMLRIAADRRLDAPARLRRVSLGDRQVAALHFACGDGAGQRGDGGERPADDHQAGGVLVEPVDDPGTRQRRARRIASEQGVEQRSRPVAGGRMDDHAGGLVDHEHVVVFVDDIASAGAPADRRGSPRSAAGRRRDAGRHAFAAPGWRRPRRRP